MMINQKEIKSRRTAVIRAAFILLAMMLAVILSAANLAYAEGEGSEEPIREVHNVGVDGKAYCFFVTHNVVLTPAEVAELDDEQLTEVVLSRAGLYIKEANCNNKKHKSYTPDKWTEGICFISDQDIASIRAAEPEDGSPVKIYMDLRIATFSESDSEDEEETVNVYTTFKRTGAKLLFVVVATEEDAANGEDICADIPEKPKKEKVPSWSGNQGGGEEMLPEYRTINMVDRSGEPLEDTLQDGDPVNLEWIEPGKQPEEGKSFIDYIPGRYAGLAFILAAMLGLLFFIITRRRRDEED